MTEEEFMQLLARQVQAEVERQLPSVVTKVLRAEEERRWRHRQTLLWELKDLQRLADLDPAALPEKP
jgi:hypothetical protein